MPLTPNDIANKEFSKGFRGYDMGEVDGFLDEVEAELVRLLRDNNDLRLRGQQGGEAEPAAAGGAFTPPPAAAAAPPVVDAQQAALRTLTMAQRTAELAVSEARAEAEQLLREAREEAAESVARRDTVLTELDGRRRQLESQIEELRAFERDYRSRLKAYLQAQLSDLDGQGDGSAGSGQPGAGPDRLALADADRSDADRSGTAVPPVDSAQPVQAEPAGPPQEARPGEDAVAAPLGAQGPGSAGQR